MNVGIAAVSDIFSPKLMIPVRKVQELVSKVTIPFYRCLNEISTIKFCSCVSLKRLDKFVEILILFKVNDIVVYPKHVSKPIGN